MTGLAGRLAGLLKSILCFLSAVWVPAVVLAEPMDARARPAIAPGLASAGQNAASTSLASAAPLDMAGPVFGRTWLPLGPAPIAGVSFSGRVASIAVSASRPGDYVAGAASGGVWTSRSGGAFWRARGDDLPTLAIGAVAMDPTNERILYAGSGEAHYAHHSLYGLGVYKSVDRGRTWRQLAAETFSGRTFSRLVVAPSGSPIWAAVARAGGTVDGLEGAKLHPDRLGPTGLFRSDDGGETWHHVTAGLPAIPATDVDMDPQNPGRILVTFGDPYGHPANGIYQSLDGGATFQAAMITGAFVGRTTLAIAPSDPLRVYALAANRLFPFNLGGFLPFGGSTAALFRSDDGGTTWSTLQPGNLQGSQGQYVSAVAVSSADPDQVFLGGVSLLRSTDGGASYQDVTPPHVDIQDLAFDAAGRLLAATDGGVFRSPDGGDTWEARNQGLSNAQHYAGLSTDPFDRRTMLTGTQDNGSILRGSDGEWTMVAGGDGGYTAIAGSDPDVMFVSFQGVGNLFRSTDGGLSFVLSNTGIDVNADWSAFQAPFVIDPGAPLRMLYGTQRVYESLDLGQTWSPISSDLTDGGLGGFAAIRSLTIAPSDGSTVYATTNNERLLVSTDGGATWDVTREGVAGWPRIMRQVAVDPQDASMAIAAVGRFDGDRVLATTDRGVTWSAIGGDLPNVPVNTVAVHRLGHWPWASRRLVFAGTDDGVYFSSDHGVHWRRFGRRLPRAPIADLVVDAEHGRLIAATLGRGVWVARLPGW